MSLLLHLPFATVGATTPDTSGNGYDGTLVGAPSQVRGPVPNLPGLAMDLVTPSLLQCPVGASPSGDTFSVAFWAKIGSNWPVRTALWSCAGAPQANSLGPWIEIIPSALRLVTPGVYRVDGDLTGWVGNFQAWNHYAWIRTASGTNQAYVNCVPLTMNNLADLVLASTSVTAFGSRYYPTFSLNSNAQFADPWVYNEAITFARLRQIFCESRKTIAALVEGIR